MLENYNIFKLLNIIGWRTKFYTSALLATAMIIVSYTIIDDLTKDTVVFAQPQQTESTYDTSRNDNKYEEQVLRAVEGAKTIKQAMKNPNSFQLEMIRIMPSGSTCYTYLSQDEVGNTNKGVAVLVKNEIKTDEMQGFDQRWQDECHGKEGKDATGFGKLMIY